jgi:hypothetical protein
MTNFEVTTPVLNRPLDEPSDDRKVKDFNAFRLACKMATGSGKTTVMGMLAAWSILNKIPPQTESRAGNPRKSRIRNHLPSRGRLPPGDPQQSYSGLDLFASSTIDPKLAEAAA